jgi:hypothetical protein
MGFSAKRFYSIISSSPSLAISSSGILVSSKLNTFFTVPIFFFFSDEDEDPPPYCYRAKLDYFGLIIFPPRF